MDRRTATQGIVDKALRDRHLIVHSEASPLRRIMTDLDRFCDWKLRWSEVDRMRARVNLFRWNVGELAWVEVCKTNKKKFPSAWNASNWVRNQNRILNDLIR